MEVLVIGLGRVGCKELICRLIRQLTVTLGKVIIPVQNDYRVALVGRMRILVQREQSVDFLDLERLGC